MKHLKFLPSFLLILLLFAGTSVSFAQTDKNKDAPIVFIVEQMPVFPGGEDSMYKFITANVTYPQVAREKNISGTVIIIFIVEQDGSITNAKVVKGIGGGCDEEALRVVKLMPKWNPGKQAGKPCRVQFQLPLKFSLS